MGRKARVAPAGVVYHVLNRANGRRELFGRGAADYAAFCRVLAEALAREPGVELFCFCLMPNHWHLVLRPTGDAAQLGRFMRWLTQTHAVRWRHARRSVGQGSLYQGRFKSFPVQEDRHFLLLCRYVERNAVRARLAPSAARWPWGSAAARALPPATRAATAAASGPPRPADAVRDVAARLTAWPVRRPPDWAAHLAADPPPPDADRVRQSLRRGRPLGDPAWTARAAARLKLAFTLRPPGRPPKAPPPPRAGTAPVAPGTRSRQ